MPTVRPAYRSGRQGLSGFRDSGSKAKEQFSKAKKIIREIASKISDEEMKDNFLNAMKVRSVYGWETDDSHDESSQQSMKVDSDKIYDKK